MTSEMVEVSVEGSENFAFWSHPAWNEIRVLGGDTRSFDLLTDGADKIPMLLIGFPEFSYQFSIEVVRSTWQPTEGCKLLVRAAFRGGVFLQDTDEGGVIWSYIAQPEVEVVLEAWLRDGQQPDANGTSHMVFVLAI